MYVLGQNPCISGPAQFKLVFSRVNCIYAREVKSYVQKKTCAQTDSEIPITQLQQLSIQSQLSMQINYKLKADNHLSYFLKIEL